MEDIRKLDNLVHTLALRVQQLEMTERGAIESLFNRLRIGFPEFFPSFDLTTLETKMSDNAATLRGIELQLDEIKKGYRPGELTAEERERADKQDRQYQIYRIGLELMKSDINYSPGMDLDSKAARIRMNMLYQTAESFYNRFFIDK